MRLSRSLEIFVLIEFAGRKLGVPLSQLEVIDAKGETREAVDDWRYWVAMGYEFQPQAFEVLIPCARTVQNTMAAVKSAHARMPTG